MPRFEWSECLETGDARIDAQHQSLFALANALQDAIESDAVDDDAVADCVWRLTDYVVEHFADEEEAMAQARFPGLSAHRALHAHLTAETMRVAARYFNGEDVAPASLAPFLMDWLTKHIADADMAFVRRAGDCPPGA